jgi:hypothetical protein
MKLYYEFISEFKNQYFKDILSWEHLVPDEVYFNKVTLADGGVDENADLWGFVFTYNNQKYFIENKGLNLVEELPFRPSKTEKIAYRKDVYHLVKKKTPVRFKSEKHHSFKELIKELSYFKHSNKAHQELYWLITLTSYFDKTFFRISSNPGFGKDSSMEIMNGLIGGVSNITKPTYAKLEFLCQSNLLCINEVVDVNQAQWELIEQFLLNSADGKVSITKSSRRTESTGETIDISKLSIILVYNDINNYKHDNYFDMVSRDAVQDRFTPLRLNGRVQEDFKESKNYNIKEYVDDNTEWYSNLIRSLTYYSDYNNVLKEMKGYDNSWIENYSERWQGNLKSLSNRLDLMCDTQKEYDDMVAVIKDAIVDYKHMLNYPTLLKLAKEKLKKIDHSRLIKKVDGISSFVNKNKALDEVITTKELLVDYGQQVLL